MILWALSKIIAINGNGRFSSVHFDLVDARMGRVRVKAMLNNKRVQFYLGNVAKAKENQFKNEK